MPEPIGDAERPPHRTTIQEVGGRAVMTDDDIPMPGWHALYTRHQHERMTARILEHKGFEVFLPLYSVAHRWKDRTKHLLLPLFPCYLFVRGGLDRRVEMLSAPGVHSLVRSGNQIAIVPDPEIEAVRRVLANCVPAEPHPFLRCGDRVKVISGPLAGIEGVLVRKKDQSRLILSVELLQRSIAVEVDGVAVEPVESSRSTIEHRGMISIPAYA